MKRDKIFEEAVYGEYKGWLLPPYDDEEVLAYGMSVKEFRKAYLPNNPTEDDVHRIEDQIGSILFWKRKAEYDEAKERDEVYSEEELEIMKNMGWGDKSDYLRENGYHLVIEETNGGGMGDEGDPKWLASIDGEWRTYGNSIPEVIGNIFDSIILSNAST